MMRFYFSCHYPHKDLITENSHVARLIINSFEQPEVSIEYYYPYITWKRWLSTQKNAGDQAN